MIKRRKTKTVAIGPIKIGSGYPVSIQSMTKTDTADSAATIRQIKTLGQAGCDIVRVAVKHITAVRALKKIKARVNIPLVADIHFDYRLALEAIACGIDGLRLNPGNIYRRQEVKEIAQAARRARIPIRVGVNSGSLPHKPEIKNRNPEKLADLMVQTGLNYIKLLESFDFYDIIGSLKASDVATAVKAYQKMAGVCAYPFHLGVTAAGLPQQGTIKSAIGIGSLLLAGIGDTIRVSLTASPEEEVRVAKQILQSLALRYFGPEIISCPTCGRCQVDLVKIVRDVSSKLNEVRSTQYAGRPIKVAIMGCEVNGPGEARDVEIGIACGRNSAVLFKKGKIVKRLKEKQIADAITQLIKSQAFLV